MATLNDYRLNTMLTIIDKDNLDVDRIEFLLQKADGVIIDQMASFSMKIHELIKSLRKKCVCLRWKPDVYEENYVAEDLVAGFYKVARSLLDAGHRQIAYLGCTEDDKRMAGIRQAFYESGIELDRDLCVDFRNGTRHVGYTAAEELMRRGKKFTAIISHNDDAALGIMERLLIAGLRIPDDVSITGFDNISDSGNFPVPLTTCGGNNRQLINAVISLLLNNHSSDRKEAVMIEPEMVFRSSIRKI